MKHILLISIFIISFIIPNVYGLTDLDIDARISDIQSPVPVGTPTVSGYDQKGYVGSVLSNIFDATQKIKSYFVLAFTDILGVTYNNNIPKWNGDMFKPGTMSDVSGMIGIGTLIPQAKLHVAGNIIANDPTADNHVATKGYVDSTGGGNGSGVLMGDWQDVTASRSKMIAYQNTNSSGLLVNITSSKGGPIEVSTDGIAWVQVGRSIDTSSDSTTTSIVVPPNHYYRVGSNNPSILVWAELVLGNTSGSTNSANSYGGKGEPDYQLILNDGAQITDWVCEHDIDLTNICGDGDGCSYRLLMNHKVDTNDITRNIDGDIYFEDPLFSKNNGIGLYGHTRQSGGGDYVFINGTGTRTEHMFAPWGWVYFSNHKNAYCTDVAVNTPYPASEPFKFSFMTHPYVQTKLLFWD